jgi:hypothetical protein
MKRQDLEYDKSDIKAIKEQNMLAAALVEEEETDEDEDDAIDENVELMNKLKAVGVSSETTSAGH